MARLVARGEVIGGEEAERVKAEPALPQKWTLENTPDQHAAVDPEVRGGEYYGPPGRGVRGHPVIAQPSASARDSATARKLWAVSEQLTNVQFPVQM